MFCYVYIGTNISKNVLMCTLFYIFIIIIIIIIIIAKSQKS